MARNCGSLAFWKLTEHTMGVEAYLGTFCAETTAEGWVTWGDFVRERSGRIGVCVVDQG